MANCPKCDHKLKLTDWRQICPYCGANIILYDQQERLMKEADKAEVEHYHFQKKIDRLKASFAGSKFAVIRIFACLLPIVALLIPFADLTLSPPLGEFSGKVGLINIYTAVAESTFDFGALFELISQPESKTAALLLLVSIAMLLLVVVTALVHLILLTLSCSPKGKLRNYTICSLMLVFTVAAIVCFSLLPENSFCTGSVSIGAYVEILAVVLCFVSEYLAFRFAKEIVHKQCYVGGIPAEEYFKMLEDGVPHEEIRAEMYKRLKAIQLEQEAALEKGASGI